jgi:hypothetical protein
VEANSTGGQGSRRAVAPSDDDDDMLYIHTYIHIYIIRAQQIITIYYTYIYTFTQYNPLPIKMFTQ